MDKINAGARAPAIWRSNAYTLKVAHFSKLVLILSLRGRSSGSANYFVRVLRSDFISCHDATRSKHDDEGEGADIKDFICKAALESRFGNVRADAMCALTG